MGFVQRAHAHNDFILHCYIEKDPGIKTHMINNSQDISFYVLR